MKTINRPQAVSSGKINSFRQQFTHNQTENRSTEQDNLDIEFHVCEKLL